VPNSKLCGGTVVMQGALPIDPTQAPSTLLRLLLEAALVGDTGGLEAEALFVALQVRVRGSKEKIGYNPIG
jgi:hypothetical protein